MISHTEKNIEPEDYRLYLIIKNALAKFDEAKLDYGIDVFNEPAEISCHMLAAATERIFSDKLVLENGYYFMGISHSWLVTKNRNILDVYPFGIISGPLLISRRALTSRKVIYIHKEEIMGEIYVLPGYHRAVDDIERELRRILKDL